MNSNRKIAGVAILIPDKIGYLPKIKPKPNQNKEANRHS